MPITPQLTPAETQAKLIVDSVQAILIQAQKQINSGLPARLEFKGNPAADAILAKDIQDALSANGNLAILQQIFKIAF